MERLFLIAALAGCGGDGNFECQPLCNDNGMIVPGNAIFMIGASSESAAIQACLEDAANAAEPVCDGNATVDSCSCTEVEE